MIAQTVRKAFPPGTDLTWDADEVRPEKRFFVIPDHSGPRWIVPHDWTVAKSFLGSWRPYNISSRIKWRALLIAYRQGQLGRFAKIKSLGIDTGNNADWRHLGCLLPESLFPVIYVGTPQKARKAVVGLADRDGNVSSVAKIALTDEAQRSIVHEADILKRLESEKPGLAPKSVFVNEAAGIAAQNAVVGQATGRRLLPAHVAALLALSVPSETISLRDSAETLAAQICLRSFDVEVRNVIARVLEEIDDDEPLPATWVHGDFAPWNIKQVPDGRFRAVDWENASPRGLPLFDLVYYRSIQSFLFKERVFFCRSTRRQTKTYVEQIGLNPNKIPKIVRACVLRQWWRRYQDREFEYASFLFALLDGGLGRVA